MVESLLQRYFLCRIVKDGFMVIKEEVKFSSKDSPKTSLNNNSAQGWRIGDVDSGMAAHDNIDSLDSPGQLHIFPIAKMTQKDDQIGFGFKLFDHRLCCFDRRPYFQSLSPGIGRIGKEIGRKKAKNSNPKPFDFFPSPSDPRREG